ncbi:MAG: glycosyltransferase family 4 protein [Ignavibacteriae bacterium]|nr:glycosyltransferase family 4 protein [Ignavibacteriota bacterium]
MLLKGGPRTQILQTKRCLEQLGVQVSLFESWKEFQKESIDLVHIFGANVGTYHFAREIQKLRIPMVITPIFYTRHSAPFVRTVVAVNSLVRSVARAVWTDYSITQEICSWADAALPNTKKEGELLARGTGLPKQKITVVPNGVEERFSHGDPALFKKSFGLEHFILNVGHIGPHRKNVLLLIHALEKINVPSVIIGRIEDNEYGHHCLEEAKKNPRLRIVDSLPNDSELLASAYAACDVFVLPSLYETPGIAALEAALAGAKIVVTKHGGTEEYFGEHAEYVEPTSYELIHHGIVTALNKKKDTALREHVRKHFLWSHVAEQTVRVYEKVLSSRSAD